MSPRPVSETIQIILAATIAACLAIGVLGVVVVKVVNPSQDVGAPASSLGTLLSALAGYVIGRTRRSGD